MTFFLAFRYNWTALEENRLALTNPVVCFITFPQDGTALFDKFHAWVNIDSLLRNCVVGYLVADDGQEDADSSTL